MSVTKGKEDLRTTAGVGERVRRRKELARVLPAAL